MTQLQIFGEFLKSHIIMTPEILERLNICLENEKQDLKYFCAKMQIIESNVKGVVTFKNKVEDLYIVKKKGTKLELALDAAHQFFGLPKNFLVECKSRKRTFIIQKQAFMYYAVKALECGLKETASILHYGDHTTVINAKKSFQNTLDTSPEVVNWYTDFVYFLNKNC